MPTRKQKRRREKGRRHEYEYVYVDDEGREVEVEEEPAPKSAPKPAPAARTQSRGKPGAKTPAKQAARRQTAMREVQPPSWQRVFRRAAIFAPVMVLVVYFLGRNSGVSPTGVAFQVAVLLLFFVPFSYYLDVLMYRAYRKRIGDPLPPRQRAPRKPKP